MLVSKTSISTKIASISLICFSMSSCCVWSLSKLRLSRNLLWSPSWSLCKIAVPRAMWPRPPVDAMWPRPQVATRIGCVVRHVFARHFRRCIYWLEIAIAIGATGCSCQVPCNSVFKVPICTMLDLALPFSENLVLPFREHVLYTKETYFTAHDGRRACDGAYRIRISYALSHRKRIQSREKKPLICCTGR